MVSSSQVDGIGTNIGTYIDKSVSTMPSVCAGALLDKFVHELVNISVGVFIKSCMH